MPISIRQSPEPNSPVCLTTDEDPILIGSDAARQLTDQLRGYCKGEHNGRAFLIAGHRGSGKTTMVNAAFHRVYKDTLGHASPQPVLVCLQGPTLLPPIPLPPKPADPAALPAPGPVSICVAPEPAEILLREVTLTLYTAVVEAVAKEFTKRIAAFGEEHHESRLGLTGELRLFPKSLSRLWEGLRNPNHATPVAELRELAGQVQLELEEFPAQERIVELWDRAGLLDGGLFGPLANAPSGVVTRRGVLEVVALVSLIKARRLVSGKLAEDYKRLLSGSFAEQADLAGSTPSGDGMKMFLALLAGGTAGSGAQLAGLGGSASILSGALTALGSLWTLKYSATWSRKRTLDYSETFVPDRSVSTLERVLPQLIEQLRLAGLAPVFVVDELDKVPDLASRLELVIPRLKKLVAERAFFCFLVDRDYFERIRTLSADHSYAKEYTFFTHQLFVTYTPADYHQYLRTMLGLPDPGSFSPLPFASSTPGAGSSNPPAAPSSGSEAAHELDFAQVFPFLLLHAAQMHPLDLKRELANWRDADGNVRLSVGVARTWRGYRCELLMQLAIECVLESEELTAQFQYDPAFRRVAYDALYYPSRQWDRGDKVDLRDENIKVFEAYLVARMLSRSKGQNGALEHHPEDAALNLDYLLTCNQRRLLYESVRRLVRMLAGVDSWREEFYRHRKLKTGVTDAVQDKPLLRNSPDSPSIYQWCYDRAGTEIPEPAAPGTPAPAVSPHEDQQWERDQAVIDEVVRSVHDWGGGTLSLEDLANNYRLISTSPAYGEMRLAQARLAAAARNQKRHDTYERDAGIVHDFAEMLQHDVDNLGAGLLCAHFLALNFVPYPDPLRHALEAIADCLRLDVLPSKSSQQLLNKLCDGLAQRSSVFGEAWQATTGTPPSARTRWTAGIERVKKVGMISVDDEMLRPMIENAWRAWKERYAFGDDVPADAKALADLVICRCIDRGPAFFLAPRPENMTCRRWSVALVAALMACEVKGQEPCQRWVLWAAIRGLGLPVNSTTPLFELLSKQGDKAPPDDAEWFLIRNISTSATVHATALIVLPDSGSNLEHWVVDSRMPALMLTLREIDCNSSAPHGAAVPMSYLGLVLRFDILAVESPMAERVLSDTFDHLSFLLKPNARTIGLFTLEPPQSPVGTFVVANDMSEFVESVSQTGHNPA